MKINLKNIVFTGVISLTLALATSAAVKTVKPVSSVPAQKQNIAQPMKPDDSRHYEQANALDIVANPSKYLNKRVKIKAKFDKFSTLGLDYKPAFRSSERYITFLIKRDDVINHTVPLSEMKNFLLRDEAEKYIDLKPGDSIEYSGLVFSDALGDVWINVEKFIVLSQQSKEKTPAKK